MAHQLTFADSEFQKKRRKTRKEIFLERMELIIPWGRLEAVIEPYYPKAGNGRRPYPLATMLRIHLLQQWYNLSDPAAEDALYEVASMRLFARLSLDKPIPDHTTIMNFRHLLERHQLGREIFEEINLWLEDAGVLLREGTLMDATIIDAPSSIKNSTGERDPEMHQTRKGNQWYFGMKAHIGVDSMSGLVHSFETTAANVHDVTQAVHLLHGEEKYVYADSGYRGVESRTGRWGKGIDWKIALMPSKVKTLRKPPRINKHELEMEYYKSSLRAPVEHAFGVIKCQFGFRKTRYRGLKKNDNKLSVLFALANVVRVCRRVRF
ncbi:IS5 family transposase [Neiella marina]|uniref:IS5 family transposase n=1 Tax=Neiella holothuriorum TaxID=2870530 RepID=A0ABS7EI78_9GAMM|nr:IS5 family transposase [Neiella holothuriorum]MBW8192049.1 IS5 family transposase [Neiella holothuriorum]